MSSIKRLTNHLLRLASLELQVKYCVNGTQREYIVVDELIHDIHADLEFHRSAEDPDRWPAFEKQVGENVLRHVLRIESLCEASPDFLEQYTFATLEELIHNDPTWAAIRSEAQFALEAMQVDWRNWDLETEGS